MNTTTLPGRASVEATASAPRVGYIVRSYPRLSQTFILNEILALEQLGVQVHIFAVTHPHESIVQTQVADVQAPVDYLEVAQQRRWWVMLWEHLWTMLWSPYRYGRALYYVFRHPEIDQGYNASSRYACFLQAVYLAHLLRRERRRFSRSDGSGGINHLHAHFAHDPTLIAQLVHGLTGISYTFTAHARDIYQIPQSALATRIEQGSAVVTCCAINIDYLKATAPTTHHAKLRVIHNGVNLQEFQPRAEEWGSRGARERGNGGTGESTSAPLLPYSPAPPLILSASRLVEKKGYPDLLRACQQLKQEGHPFRCVIYGDGPLHKELNDLVKQLGLSNEVTLPGACTQQELRQVMPQAAIFALTPFVTEDGDRDGVPTVLVEAMACGLPVVSTTVAGITELVTHDYNGLLAAPHDVATIAAALAALLHDEPKRRQLGLMARRTVAEQFDLHTGAQQLADLFQTMAQGVLQ